MKTIEIIILYVILAKSYTKKNQYYIISHNKIYVE